MMKSLLFVVAALMALSAGAQFKSQDVAPGPPLPLTCVKPQVQVQEMQMRASGEPVKAPHKNKLSQVPYYNRPAGAFHASIVTTNGYYNGMIGGGVILMKPYCEYTFYGNDNESEWHDGFWWHYTTGDEDNYEDHAVYARDLTVKHGIESYWAPVISVDEFSDLDFEYPGFRDNVNLYPYNTPAAVWTQTLGSYDDEDGNHHELVLASKTFCQGGRYGDLTYTHLYFHGLKPYGGNDYGWWFGKNCGYDNGIVQYAIDGIAQAFEKPTAPYVLNQVVMHCPILEVAAPVEMACKVYKLDAIPAYDDSNSVYLRDEPGELIAFGRATVTPETKDATGGLVYFTLYNEEDGLEYEVTPTIDSAILVVIEGYNNPEMANLTNFTAAISTDMDVDEGFGELAYIKLGTLDAEGNVNQYFYCGLNNFFSHSRMMTGLTIYITADLPYLVFYHMDEDGEYTFPYEGGRMDQYIGINPGPYPSIIFRSSVPSVDNGWTLSCNGEEVPDWLSIELTDDEENGEFGGFVFAEVFAEPLPEGVQYREAVVRFEAPGAYLDYKFMQGELIPPDDPCGVVINGEITIAVVNHMVDLLLNDMYDNCFDFNEDGELTVADINTIIDYILTH